MKQGFIAVLVLLIWSCSSPSKETPSGLSESEIKQKQEWVKGVMAVHDEAMPWMDDILSLKQEFKAQLDTVTSPEADTIKLHILALDNAEESMMSWMRTYREPNNQVSLDSARIYLQEQKVNAESMRSIMRKAIDEAKQYMEQ